MRHGPGLLRRAFVALVIGLTVFGSVQAEGPPPKPVKVTITRTDGKVVAGELIESSPAAVKVRPSPKAEPVTITWSMIRRAGGVNRGQVVADWRAHHPDQLCPTCTGEGTQKCVTCDGTGVDPAQAADCTVCHGTGFLGECKKCHGTGQMPCPGNCIKDIGFGPKDAEGKRWRSFRGRAGTLRVSEGHVGQQVTMVNGEPQLDQTLCPICGGSTRVLCDVCSGTGKTPCPRCHATGKVGPACADCKGSGKQACPTCDGSGMKAGAA